MQNIQNLQEIIYVMGGNESKKKNYQYYYRRNIHETKNSQIFRIKLWRIDSSNEYCEINGEKCCEIFTCHDKFAFKKLTLTELTENRKGMILISTTIPH